MDKTFIFNKYHQAPSHSEILISDTMLIMKNRIVIFIALIFGLICSCKIDHHFDYESNLSNLFSGDTIIYKNKFGDFDKYPSPINFSIITERYLQNIGPDASSKEKFYYGLTIDDYSKKPLVATYESILKSKEDTFYFDKVFWKIYLDPKFEKDTSFAYIIHPVTRNTHRVYENLVIKKYVDNQTAYSILSIFGKHSKSNAWIWDDYADLNFVITNYLTHTSYHWSNNSDLDNDLITLLNAFNLK